MIITDQKWHLSDDCKTLMWKITVEEGASIGGTAFLEGVDQAMDYTLLFREELLEFVEGSTPEEAVTHLKKMQQQLGK